MESVTSEMSFNQIDQQVVPNYTFSLCSSEIIMYVIIVFGICYILYGYLKKRTINIENFDKTEKLTYSIDGHPIDIIET